MIYVSAQTCLMQINIRFYEANRNMNTKYLVLVAAMAAMLVASTALATDNAFADKKKDGYKKSQAATQINDCGNGFEPEFVFCQNLASQIQGDNNTPVLEAEQGGDD
jgi:hypothetical protein